MLNSLARNKGSRRWLGLCLFAMAFLFVALVSGCGGSGSSGGSDSKPLVSGEKYVDSLRSFNYNQYMFLMLLLFWNNEDELLNRFADIIQMEQTNRLNTMNNSQYTLEEQLSGTKKKFDIDKAYTTIRVETSGKFVNALPIPTLSQNSAWRIQRVIYRGY